MAAPEKPRYELRRRSDNYVLLCEGDHALCATCTKKPAGVLDAQLLLLAMNSHKDLLTACKDPFSYEYGENPTFADALLNLGDNLGKLDETAIAIWKLWLLKKAEDLQAASDKAGSRL